MKQKLITDSFDGYVRLNGLFLIRETTGGTIILGKTSTPFTFEGEYPEDEFGDMYDLQGDMCLDEDEYENIEIELAQRGFLGQI